VNHHATFEMTHTHFRGIISVNSLKYSHFINLLSTIQAKLRHETATDAVYDVLDDGEMTGKCICRSIRAPLETKSTNIGPILPRLLRLQRRVQVVRENRGVDVVRCRPKWRGVGSAPDASCVIYSS
jgi:hypothetical protein